MRHLLGPKNALWKRRWEDQASPSLFPSWRPRILDIDGYVDFDKTISQRNRLATEEDWWAAGQGASDSRHVVLTGNSGIGRFSMYRSQLRLTKCVREKFLSLVCPVAQDMRRSANYPAPQR
jgi:hypothetical protein